MIERNVDLGAFEPDHPNVLEACRRETILKYALSIDAGWPTRTKEVARAIAAREAGLSGHAPSRATLTRWYARWLEGEQSYAALVDLPPQGRPPEAMDPVVERYLRRLARARPSLGATGLEQGLVAAFAARAQKGHKAPVALPSVHQIRRWRKALPLRERVMAEFGTRAARADTQIKRTYPTVRPNQMWQVDETQHPIWVRIWNSATLEWVVAVAWAVFVRDVYSRAIVSFWVKEPTVDRPLHSQFTAEEVLATLAGGAVPELAHPELRELAIRDPECVMMDGSGAMASAHLLLTKNRVIPVIDGEISGAKRSEPYAPWTNGGIENWIGVAKRRYVPEVIGAKAHWVPFQGDFDRRTLRDRNNADVRRRIPVLHEVPVELLPNIDQARGFVGWLVRENNGAETRGLRGDYPLSAFLKEAPESTEARSKFLRLFPIHEVQLNTFGIEIHDRKYQNARLHDTFPLREKLWVRRSAGARHLCVSAVRIAPEPRARSVCTGSQRVGAYDVSERGCGRGACRLHGAAGRARS